MCVVLDRLFKGIWPLLTGESALSNGQEYAWNQKLAITVDTPDGLKSAAGVTRIILEKHDSWYETPESRGVSSTVRGEAIVLELAPKQYLFALLKGMIDADQVYFPGWSPIETAPHLTTSLPPLELTVRQYPVLVTFRDIADPASVRPVDPANLEADFGSGHVLESMVMTVTDQAVTTGHIEKVLNWLGPYPEPKLSKATGRTTDIPFSRTISHGDFIRR